MTATWEPGLGDHLRTIWRYRWFLLVGALVVAEAVFLASYLLIPPRYDAESSLRLTILSEDGPLLEEDKVEYASRVYAELSESPTVLADAVDRSGITVDRDEAAKSITVDWARPPGFIDVVASAADPEDAAKLADGMAATIVGLVEADGASGADGLGGIEVAGEPVADAAGQSGQSGRIGLVAEVVEPAVEPTNRAAPNPVRNGVAAFLISLVVLAEGAALYRPARGLLPLSRTAERVTELVGIPCLSLTGDPEDRTRLAVFAARHLSPKRAALVVGCSGEALPAAAVRLGEGVASSGSTCLVVDGESREPNFHRRLGLSQAPGLAEVATGTSSIAEAVLEPQIKSRVSLLTSGGREGSREELPADTLLVQLQPVFEFVIVNVSSTTILDGLGVEVAEQGQSTILVVDPERTKRRDLSELVHSFGGHQDVIAILLMTRSAAVAETKRLAVRWWKRNELNGAGPKPDLLTTAPFALEKSE